MPTSWPELRLDGAPARGCLAVALALGLLVPGGLTAAEVGDPSSATPSPAEAAPAEPSPEPAAAAVPPPLPGLPPVPNVPSPGALERALSAWRAHTDGGARSLKAGRWKAAQGHYRSALILDPSDPEILSGLAEALERTGAARRAAILRRQAVELAADGEARAERWTEVARGAEARMLSTEALDAWRRARSLRPDPAIDARIAELRKVEAVPLMSPRSLCPGLLDAWGCAPSTRPSEGDLRCTCEIERLERTRAALVGGIQDTDPYGITTLDEGTLLAAALIRVRGTGLALLDTRYLAVETGSGGWQLVERVVEGWQPGAAYTARDGTLVEMAFRPLGDPGVHGPGLVVRVVNRAVDGDFESRTIRRERWASLIVCHGVGGLACVSAPTARRREVRAMAPGAQATAGDVDWAVDARFQADGALVVSNRGGSLPDAMQGLVGAHPPTALADLPQAVVTPLR